MSGQVPGSAFRNLNPEALEGMAALARISTMLNSSHTLGDVLEKVMDIALTVMGAERGFVMLDRGGSEPQIMVARGLDPDELQTRQYSLTAVQQVLSTHTALVSADIAGDERLASSKSLRMLMTGSLLCVPMRSQDRTLGLIYLDTTQGRMFHSEDLAPAQLLADLAAAAVERSEYVAQLLQNEKLAALGMLLPSVAHELNNPLQVILGYALMSRRCADAECRQRADLMAQQAQRGASLVNDMLLLGRQEVATFGPVYIPDVIARTTHVLEGECRRAGIEVVIQADEALPHVLGSSDQLTNVLLNLLTNAVLALKGTTRPAITILAEKVESRMVLQVRDNGPGVAPENLKRIFEDFFTTRPPGEGTGLGLALVRRIVAAHQGLVEVHNAPTGGAVFTVTLPLAV